MDTQMKQVKNTESSLHTNEESLQKLDQSSMLAKQARHEWKTTGEVHTVCPRCKSIVHVEVFENRCHVFCDCKYILNGEIYL